MATIALKEPPHELFGLCNKLMKGAPGIKQFTTQGGTPIHVMFYTGNGPPNTVLCIMRPNGKWDEFRLYRDNFKCEASVRPSYSLADRARQLIEMQLTETPPYSDGLVQSLNAAYFKLVHSTRRKPYSDESAPFFGETEADAELGAIMHGLALAADRISMAVRKGPGIHEI